MTSLRHNRADRTAEHPRRRATSTPPGDCILAVGWRRTTLTDVARRAGRLPDDDLPPLAGHADPARRPDDPRVVRRRRRHRRRARTPPAGRRRRRDSSARAALREQRAVRCRSSSVDPELLLPYLLSTAAAAPRTRSSRCSRPRSGRAGRPAASVRAATRSCSRGRAAGRARLRALGPTMTDDGSTEADLDAELRTLLERYLRAMSGRAQRPPRSGSPSLAGAPSRRSTCWWSGSA